jgi:hypothetical protein
MQGLPVPASVLGVAVREEVRVMEKAHDGMTIHQRRVLQFQLEALGLEKKYIDLNGEMPLAGYGWEPEVDGADSESRIETMPSVDRYLDRDTSWGEGDDAGVE